MHRSPRPPSPGALHIALGPQRRKELVAAVGHALRRRGLAGATATANTFSMRRPCQDLAQGTSPAELGAGLGPLAVAFLCRHAWWQRRRRAGRGGQGNALRLYAGPPPQRCRASWAPPPSGPCLGQAGSVGVGTEASSPNHSLLNPWEARAEGSVRLISSPPPIDTVRLAPAFRPILLFCVSLGAQS